MAGEPHPHSSTPGLATVIIDVAAFGLAIAAFLMILASRRISRANALLSGARSVASLLRSVPARRDRSPDGGIESDSCFNATWVSPTAVHLDQLAEGRDGIDPADLAALKIDVQTAAVSGTGISRQVRIAGPIARSKCAAAWPRRLMPAAHYYCGCSTRQGRRPSGRPSSPRSCRAPGSARRALPLIESAPFPIVAIAGPRHELGLVTRRRRRVEGHDAAEVIALGS